MRILVVDDEPAVRYALERALRLDGFEVELAADGEEALSRLEGTPADAIVLDILMPKLDGVAVCRRLRAAGDETPVLMLTARSGVGERVTGLDAGADDYLVKPFALEELQARLRAMLRRGPGAEAQAEVLTFADVRMDTGSHQVHRGDRELELTRTEYSLLRFLLEHRGQVLSSDQIFERVWGYDFGGGSNALHVYVGYLRRKLEGGGEPRILRNVRGVGYVLREP